MVDRHSDSFCKGAWTGHTHFAAQDGPSVSRLEQRHPGAESLDGPQAVAAENMGQGRLGGILPLGQVAVGGIQTRVVNPKDRLALLRNWIGHLRQTEAANAG